MKKLLGFVFISVLCIFVLVSCAGIQPKIAQFDDQNAAYTLANGKQIMKHWQMNSKVIHIGIGDEIINTKLPAEFKAQLKALDDMSIKFGTNQDAMTESDAAEAVMRLGKLIAPAIQTLIQQYAPDIWSQVMKYLPAFIGL